MLLFCCNSFHVPGEPGEFIGKIVQNDPVRDFHGYADKSATKKKVVKDVFKRGDHAFLSGKWYVKTTSAFTNVNVAEKY